MEQLAIQIPEGIPFALKISPKSIVRELLMLAAVKLYELGRLSSGAAASLAGIPRVVFLSRLADYGVNTFQLTEEELRQEASLVSHHL
ncbi:MAG: small protein [Desulfobacteraceae bacterium IS3]|jgi:predicted HTH domain antitoxin|nr:MAG: small protein [Desulfobacteraceae bacterium IS3]